jgi:hypothetical protein
VRCRSSDLPLRSCLAVVRLHLPAARNGAPQADDLGKVFEVIAAVADGADTAPTIAEALDVVERQGNYYITAALALGLIRHGADEGTYETTYVADHFAGLTAPHAIRRRMREIVLAAPHLKRIANRLRVTHNGEAIPFPPADALLDVEKVARVLEEEGYAAETALRRAYCVRAWMKTIMEVSFPIMLIISCVLVGFSPCAEPSEKQRL